MEKFLLCRPRGGLNDNLVQIEKCWRYCDEWGRTLVIDTRSSGGFGLPFGLFFKATGGRDGALLWASPNFLERLNELPSIPTCVSGGVDKYTTYFEPGLKNFCETTSKSQVSFDFEIDYREPLLVHDQCGGGVLSASCLNRLTLTEEFKRDVLSRLSILQGLDYTAIVVRNTDYRTDYMTAFSQIQKDVVGKNLLVCSDDQGVIDYAYSYFTNTRVLVLPGVPIISGKPIATASLEGGSDLRYKLVVKALSDLIGLSRAGNLFITKLINKKGYEYSGFVRLSAILYKRKMIVDRLLDE